MDKIIVSKCKKLLAAFENGELGQTKMPEDSHPDFSSKEGRLAYFSLPMSLNYQRDSYKLWESALATYNDLNTKCVFDVNLDLEEDEIRKLLLKHRVALQPNKHINTWKTISQTVSENWGSFTKLMEFAEQDFLKLRSLVQVEHKKGFPYLSGPKIFNYWSHIIQEYGKVSLKNSEFIEIAPDTHVTKCSVKLGVCDGSESKEELNLKWRKVLEGSGINPIDMHSPLWFWSRNGFLLEV